MNSPLTAHFFIFFLLLLELTIGLNSCTGSYSKENNKERLQDVSIAPGTVKATAEIISLENHEWHYFADVRITDVIAYGAASPLIPEQSELKVKINKSAVTKSSKNLIVKIGETLNILLQYLPGTNNSDFNWQVLKID